MRIEIINDINFRKQHILEINDSIKQSQELIKDTNTRYQYLVQHPEKALPVNSKGYTELQSLEFLAKDMIDLIPKFKSHIKNLEQRIARQEEILRHNWRSESR